jgi:RES domain
VKLAACASLPGTPENDYWFRLIETGHLSTALSTAYAKKAVSRFNAGSFLDPADQFATLYFADDPLPAQFEVGALLGDPRPGAHVPHPRKTFVTLNVHIILHDVVDLTDEASAQIPLETNVQELTGDWKGYQIRNRYTSVSGPTGIAPTQQLGRALFDTGVEGFRAISARVPYHKTLVVFVDSLQKGSELTFSDGSGVVHRIAP